MDHLIDEHRLRYISEQSMLASTVKGKLYKQRKTNKGQKRWEERYCALYQNILFEFDREDSSSTSFVVHLEHCTAESLFGHPNDTQNCFSVTDYNKDIQLFDNAHVYMHKDRSTRDGWVEAINKCSYSSVKYLKEELECRNKHLLRVVEDERIAKWQLQEFSGEQTKQLQRLRQEMPALISKKVEEELQKKEGPPSDDIIKIKKIQSFFRGVLSRRRWHTIVKEYIRSPHAESMRKRNRIVFLLVQEESVYVECLSLLIAQFYRPFKMAASSKNKPVSHEEVNSIFLNSETIMFLHQIFLKGLRTRMESWPKLILGDLFDMLLPMLSIYQEYVRNHHYSMQTLTNCKQKSTFRNLLKSLEEKQEMGGQTLENFLTYPMHQIPKYIATLQKLLALTPFDHVERKSLEHAQSVLEELSAMMHDEVSETENIRQNLSIERQLQDGCELLLDSTEVLIKKGMLVQVGTEHKPRKREQPVYCFLFTRILLVTSRTSNGMLSCGKFGKIQLKNVSLIEDVVDEDIDMAQQSYDKAKSTAFKLVVKDSQRILLIANSVQDKSAWVNDISQCMENLIDQPDLDDDISIESRRSFLSIRSDPRLFTDSDDIKYGNSLDSCRLLRIRYASVDRLLQRLFDVRFLSVEFLNVFLTTYPVFTSAEALLTTISSFYKARSLPCIDNPPPQPTVNQGEVEEQGEFLKVDAPGTAMSRRHSSPLSLSGELPSEQPIFPTGFLYPTKLPPSPRRTNQSESASCKMKTSESKSNLIERKSPDSKPNLIETKFSDDSSNKAKPVERKASLVGTKSLESKQSLRPMDKCAEGKPLGTKSLESKQSLRPMDKCAEGKPMENKISTASLSPPISQFMEPVLALVSPPKNRQEMRSLFAKHLTRSKSNLDASSIAKSEITTPPMSKHLLRPQSATPSCTVFSFDTASLNKLNKGIPLTDLPHSPSPITTPPTPGVIVTSYKRSQRRSTLSEAAAAFAVAASGTSTHHQRFFSSSTKFRSSLNFKFSNEEGGNLVTSRVLKIIKHWLTKEPEFFRREKSLRAQLESFLLTLIQAPDTTQTERKITNFILKNLVVDVTTQYCIPILTESASSSITLECVSSFELAQHITLVDHILLSKVQSRELLSKNWMSDDKVIYSPNLLKTIERFNLMDFLLYCADIFLAVNKKLTEETSRLVSSEIIQRQSPAMRANAIEKWASVANACRCLHNFNAVLAIVTSFTSSAIYRLKKTWEKVNKHTKQLIETLKTMVSADERFRNLRQALRCCDPPCVPYLGVYLSDLSFVEERADFITTGLVNFTKVKMVASIIEEIRFYQRVQYQLGPEEKILRYYLNYSIMSEEHIYTLSLELEPRRSPGANLSARNKFPFNPFAN